MPRAGDTIADRYILERPIAEGGMGSVWRARHRTLGRCFAIKFLKTSIPGGDSLRERFLDEARMAASVQHRFVVDIVDFGVTADAVPYMVLAFLQGESLERRRRRLPPIAVPELLRLGADVLLGLEAVHQAGIIHRDLKPENIMLVEEADGIIPKLVDFGISRLEAEPPQGRRRITQPGAVLGTPWYMSPEQARHDPIDRHSDLYSMGVILYEVLVGVPPFDHPELPALLEQVRTGNAQPLHERRPELGEALSAAIARAMAFQPSARFESAAQMAAHLLELSAQLPATLVCAVPALVSRTDTELVEPPAPRRRTRELSAPLPPARAWRHGRSLVYAGAVAAAALLAWLTVKGGPAPDPVEPATAEAAELPAPQVVATVPEEPEPPRPISRRGPETLTASAGPAEERHRRRAPGRPERREAGRAAPPVVFRSPGF